MRSAFPIRLGVIALGTAIIAAFLGIGAQPKAERIRIVYTNDTMGYLEPPCTCPGRKAGGMARLATLIRKVASEHPGCVIVDSGNLCDVADKLKVMIPILRDLGYDAVGVGQTDLLAASDLYFEEAARNKLTVLHADPDAPKSCLPYLIKSVNGVKVGIVSFGATVLEENRNEYLFRKSYYNAYKQARDSSDILVVLDQANLINEDWLQRNAKRLGLPDVVIAGMQRVGLAEPQVIGRTMFVPTTDRTRQLGVVDVELVSGQKAKHAWRRVENYWDMRANTGDAAEDDKVRTMLWQFLRPGQEIPKPGETVQPEASKHTTARAPQTPLQTASGKPYYSPELCKTCHIKQYEDWAKTKHAQAILTLVKENRMQAECIECHSEQYRRTKAVTIPKDNTGGVECATCHMDALPHGLERVAVNPKTRVSAVMCLDCHTKEHSPDYDEQAYFPRVAHPGAKAPQTASATKPH